MPPIIEHKDRIVRVHLKPLVQNAQEVTYLTADVAAGGGTLTVENIGDFADNSYLVLGEIGGEKTEMLEINGAPSGTTITLAANTVFAHSRGTKVYRVEFDQLEISHAATLTGSKSVLMAAEDLQVHSLFHEYLDVAQTTGFYFARFKETVGGTFSNYSDGVPYSGWAYDQVGYAVDYALKRNKTTFKGVVDVDFVIDEVNACLRNIQGKLKRWPQHQKFDSIAGQTTRGIHTLTLPTDIYDVNSNKSILGVRIGDQQGLTYIDPLKMQEKMKDAKTSQVRTQASANDATLDLDNSYDFNDSGSLSAYVSGTKDAFTYTGVTRDDASGGTAQITGIPTSGANAIGQTIVVDTNIWQDEEEGLPIWFTVENGKLKIWPLPDANYDNQNIYLDYWTQADSVNSMGDTLDTQRADMVKFWLTWKIRMQLTNDGIISLEDGDFILYKEALNDAIRTSKSPVTGRTGPKINRIKY
jgi:hypothetical protein